MLFFFSFKYSLDVVFWYSTQWRQWKHKSNQYWCNVCHRPAEGEQAITIDWDEDHGYCNRMDYLKGKLVVKELGYYYVYAKTCFRYYRHGPEDSSQPAAPPVDIRNTQLIQYVYRESIKQNSKAIMLMKTGSTVRLNSTSYNMYCAQQGRGVHLENGDALYVNVSNAWMLDLEGEGTYFGAIKLGN